MPEQPESASIVVQGLGFAYAGHEPVLSSVALELPRGSRCLLCGANGAAKSTLLQVLGGKTMVDRDAVRVLGQPPFHTTDLTCGGDLSYLGSQWRRTVACVGSVTVAGDISAGGMIHGVAGVDAARRDELISLLAIDLAWRMNAVSDGQRRRVQICLGLLKPYQVLLCDEVTVDLDVVARVDLLRFFQRETDGRGATVVFCTHIFDGLDGWPTHLAYLERGRLKRFGTCQQLPELFAGGPLGPGGKTRLLETMEAWLRAERDERLAAGEGAAALVPGAALKGRASPFASRHMAYYR